VLIQVSLKNLVQQQKPLTVSLISFLLMLLIVVIIGLVGGRHIINYLEQQLVEHGIDHNEEIIAGMQPLLIRSLEDGKNPDIIVADYQRFIEHAEPFGVRLFLVDLLEKKIIADSLMTKQLPYPVQQLVTTPVHRFDGTKITDANEWNGTAWRKTSNGAIELLTLHPLYMPPAANGQQWALGVSSDLSELLVLMDELHLHLDVVLLITYGLIGLLGFLTLRWVGRRYEFGLEQTVRARTEELEKAHEELLNQARLVTIGQTASVLAHEMRNPLASIKLALSGVNRSDNLPEREKQRVALVSGEVDRLEKMLNETLEYVRPIVKDEQPVMLDTLIDKVLELEQPLLDENGLTLLRQRCEQCPALKLDSIKMQQVLLNLIKNAREASFPDGELHINVSKKQGFLVFSISNEGQPLNRQIRERAFDFFFTTKAKGTGLGLGLVKRVVEEHGGNVSLSSNADGTTVVKLTLPL
jgi:signal transduction histidine kinase